MSNEIDLKVHLPGSLRKCPKSKFIICKTKEVELCDSLVEKFFGGHTKRFCLTV